MLQTVLRTSPKNGQTDALKIAELRRMAAGARTVAAKAGYLALAEAIEKARPSPNRRDRTYERRGGGYAGFPAPTLGRAAT